MNRPCCIWLESFAIQVLTREDPDLAGHPVAIYTPRQRIAEANRTAVEAGVQVSMRVREATSFATSLALFPMPENLDLPLTETAVELLSISPRVARVGQEELLVDLAPALHLFAGEAAMVQALHSAIAKLGYTCRLCVADSIAAARLGARLLTPKIRRETGGRRPKEKQPKSQITNPKSPSPATGPACSRARLVMTEKSQVVPNPKSEIRNPKYLPPATLQGKQEKRFIRSLRIEQLAVLPEFHEAADNTRLFSYLGLKTLKDVARRMRGTSALFCSDAVSTRLKDTFTRLTWYACRSSQLEKDLRFVREEELFTVRIGFSPPVADLQRLLYQLEQAFGSLGQRLYRRRRLLARLQLVLVAETGDETTLDLTLATPTRKAAHLTHLVHLKLDHVALGAPLAECRIEVVQLCPQHAVSRDLLSYHQHTGGTIEELANRLDAGLGRSLALFRVQPLDSLLPEESFRPVAATGEKAGGWGLGAGGKDEKQKNDASFLLLDRSDKPTAHPITIASDGHRLLTRTARTLQRPPAEVQAPRPKTQDPRLPVPSLRLAYGPDARLLYEFEFYDPKSCRVRRHRYFSMVRNNRTLLVKEVQREQFQVVGADD